MKKHFFTLVCLSILIVSCNNIEDVTKENKSPVLPEATYNYADIKLPMGIAIPQDQFFNEFNMFGDFEPAQVALQIDDNKATLGRVLFYDTNLSLNNTISCGSCHLQSKAFADGTAVSTGFEGRVTDRNSMAIINPIVQRNLFWDSRSFSIEDLSLKPVQHQVEMGMEDLNMLVEKLSQIDYYPDLFEKAFDSKKITSDKISTALTNFVGSITTSDSKFDKSIETQTQMLSDLELLGQQVFQSERAMCGSCHSGTNFSAQDGPFDPYGGGSTGGEGLKGTTNIGLDFISEDQGRENGSFRIPSLRNIALTGPYMHDGRFATLEEVIDHYRFGIKPVENLDIKFKDSHGDVKMLDISETEKHALIAFLHTLTDETLLTDPKYSDPFAD